MVQEPIQLFVELESIPQGQALLFAALASRLRESIQPSVELERTAPGKILYSAGQERFPPSAARALRPPRSRAESSPLRLSLEPRRFPAEPACSSQPSAESTLNDPSRPRFRSASRACWLSH